jgi:hypothetical protein
MARAGRLVAEDVLYYGATGGVLPILSTTIFHPW